MLHLKNVEQAYVDLVTLRQEFDNPLDGVTSRLPDDNTDEHWADPVGRVGIHR